jgi:hypothetical protein
MSSTSEQALRPELDHGEHLHWSGRPRQGLYFRRSDIFLVPLSLVWGGFGLTWAYFVVVVAGGHAPLIMQFFGTMFAALGIYFIAGRFLADSFRRAHIFYGVTDRRVLIVSGFLSRQVVSIALRSLNDYSLEELGGSRGTITFGSANPMSVREDAYSLRLPSKAPPRFELIEAARGVYAVIQEHQRLAQL